MLLPFQYFWVYAKGTQVRLGACLYSSQATVVSRQTKRKSVLKLRKNTHFGMHWCTVFGNHQETSTFGIKIVRYTVRARRSRKGGGGQCENAHNQKPSPKTCELQPRLVPSKCVLSCYIMLRCTKRMYSSMSIRPSPKSYYITTSCSASKFYSITHHIIAISTKATTSFGWRKTETPAIQTRRKHCWTVCGNMP